MANSGEEFDSIEKLAKEVKKRLDDKSTLKKKVMVLYAFNTTGKTRLSNILNDSESDEIKALCYNAFLEDIFTWDNDDYIFRFNPDHWAISLVKEQGLEKDIIENYNDFFNSKIEPSFDFEKGEVIFKLVTGDEKGENEGNIKISRSEERVFVWSIFFTILETALDALSTKKGERTTSIFDNLKYIIIDDPISSIDDTKIITMALKLVEKIKSFENNGLKFFITTHHALFYNVLANSFRDKGNELLILYRENYNYKLSNQGDSPFSYHLRVKEIIEKAIQNNNIEKYHFNLFRSLLEKTANFLGYNYWADCLLETEKKDFKRLLDLYSHNRLADLEGKYLSNDDKDLFKEVFSNFITRFKWK